MSLTQITSQQEIVKRLKQLKGIWEGRGFADFPTIEAADYVERLIIKSNEIEPLLFFEQQTWKSKDLSDRSEPLHWQAGFIIVSEDGKITMNNAQNSARTEVLQGEMRASGSSENKFELHLKSVAFSNDPRMLSSGRIFKFEGDKLTYSLTMAIQAAPKQQTHLVCELHRLQAYL